MSTHADFQTALARYYKTERDRNEQCLADIVDLAAMETPSDEEKVRNVLDRLIKHYSR